MYAWSFVVITVNREKHRRMAVFKIMVVFSVRAGRVAEKFHHSLVERIVIGFADTDTKPGISFFGQSSQSYFFGNLIESGFFLLIFHFKEFQLYFERLDSFVHAAKLQNLLDKHGIRKAIATLSPPHKSFEQFSANGLGWTRVGR